VRVNGDVSLNSHDDFTNNIETVNLRSEAPQIYPSPDASLIIITGVNPAPPNQANVQTLSVYEISNPANALLLSGAITFENSFVAQVEPASNGHQLVSIKLDGSSATTTVKIY
jgi:hypothetical protein